MFCGPSYSVQCCDEVDEDVGVGVGGLPPPHSAGPGADHAGLGLRGSPPVLLSRPSEIRCW